MNIYIGNLDYNTQESDVKELFDNYGEVSSVRLITDKYTGKAKGFGFIEMTDEEAANKAILEINDSMFNDRKIIVNHARPMQSRNN